MKIEIFNPNNPGAKFTSHTEKTLFIYYQELEKHKGELFSFSDFRKQMQINYYINNSNSRNIFAFCKKCGLLNYETGRKIMFENFFTDLGKAYIKVIESIEILEKEQNKSKDELESLDSFYALRQNIIFECLKKLLEQKECEYVKILYLLLKYLLKNNFIDKTEYALLLFYINKDEKEFESILKKYRQKKIQIDVLVNVRNDDPKIKTERINKDLGFLTSWSYLVGMLKESGLIEKKSQYYVLRKDKRILLEEFIRSNEND